MSAETHTHTVVKPPVYIGIYFVLLGLMAATVKVYDIGEQMHFSAALALGLALAIALVKAVLVVLFFMQVKYNTRLTWLWAAIGFIWLFLMSGIILDYVSRFYLMPPDIKRF